MPEDISYGSDVKVGGGEKKVQMDALERNKKAPF
jgi:hypothetical protein